MTIEDLDSFNAKIITTRTTKERIKAIKTGRTSPYTVAPKIPARAGPITTYASATDTFQPVSPSTALARNRTANGRVITTVPIIAELTLNRSLTGKNKATRKIIHPARVPRWLTNRIFFLP